jgi:hypothetical protein
VLTRFEWCGTDSTTTVEIQAELHAQDGLRLLWSGTLRSQVVVKITSSSRLAEDVSASLSLALKTALQQLGKNSGFAQAVANVSGRSPVRPSSPDQSLPPPPIY